MEKIDLKKLRHDINSVYFKLDLISRLLERKGSLSQENVTEISKILKKNSITLKLISQYLIYNNYSEKISQKDISIFIDSIEELAYILSENSIKKIKQNNTISFKGYFKQDSELKKFLIYLATDLTKKMNVNLKFSEDTIILKW